MHDDGFDVVGAPIGGPVACASVARSVDGCACGGLGVGPHAQWIRAGAGHLDPERRTQARSRSLAAPGRTPACLSVMPGRGQ